MALELASIVRHRALDRGALARHVDQQIGVSGVVHLVGEHPQLGGDVEQRVAGAQAGEHLVERRERRLDDRR